MPQSQSTLARQKLIDDIAVEGGRYVLSWKENISAPLPTGYAEFHAEMPGLMTVTAFEGTPFFGKHAVYSLNTSDLADGLRELPGTGTINWPNSAAGVSSSVFGFDAFLVASGFLVPTHTRGGVFVVDASTDGAHLPAPVKITRDKYQWLRPDSGWFYHKAHLVDMNGDGRLDVLTARCQYGVWPWSNKRGELLWLEQPATDPLSGQHWAEHFLDEGPDFLFCVHPSSERLVFATTEFLNERTVLYWLEGGELHSRVIDNDTGPGFSCSWTDLNGDGREELLATNHLNQGGSVYAYSFNTDDATTSNATRHVLASGFHAFSEAGGSASPGDAEAFWPEIGAGGKPHVFVSGDNSNSIFVLVPNSQDPNDWNYSKQELADIGADVGRPALADIDGDGFTDVFIPAYDNRELVHFEFSAAA